MEIREKEIDKLERSPNHSEASWRQRFVDKGAPAVSSAVQDPTALEFGAPWCEIYDSWERPTVLKALVWLTLSARWHLGCGIQTL